MKESLGNSNILPIYYVSYGLLSSSQNQYFFTLKKILHTPFNTSNLLSMHKLFADNQVLVEFYFDFFPCQGNFYEKDTYARPS